MYKLFAAGRTVEAGGFGGDTTDGTGRQEMTYFDAISIKQELLVNMQYADVTHQTPAQALKETAMKYTNEQFAQAYKIICDKLDEEKKDLKQLFLLAVKSKSLPDENKIEKVKERRLEENI